MDYDFIICETDDEPERRPVVSGLTGWETIVFEVADEDDEAEE